MEQSENNPRPIVEESTLKHIGYALELIGEVIDEMHHSVDIEDLIKIQHHLINAKWSVPRVSFHEGAVTISTVEWEDDPTLDAREVAAEHAFLILEDLPHGDPWTAWTPTEYDHEPTPSIADELEAADLEGWN